MIQMVLVAMSAPSFVGPYIRQPRQKKEFPIAGHQTPADCRNSPAWGGILRSGLSSWRRGRWTLGGGIDIAGVFAAMRGRTEGDINILEAFAALCCRLPGIGLAIPVGEINIVGEWAEQRSRVEPIHPYHVDHRAQDDHGGGDVEERQHPEDQREHAVRRASALDRRWPT